MYKKKEGESSNKYHPTLYILTAFLLKLFIKYENSDWQSESKQSFELLKCRNERNGFALQLNYASFVEQLFGALSIKHLNHFFILYVSYLSRKFQLEKKNHRCDFSSEKCLTIEKKMYFNAYSRMIQ